MATNQNQQNTQTSNSWGSHDPMELCSIVHANQTLAIRNGLSMAGIDNDTLSPLKLYSAFSRFGLTLIQDHKFVTANLKINEIPGIIQKSRICAQKEMDLLMESALNSDNPKSPAYTVKLSGKDFAGITPAQALLNAGNDPDKIKETKEKLNSLYSWLKKNAERYPRNKTQMDAIAEAGKLFSEGKLSAEDAADVSVEGREIVIFDSSFRPLTRRPQRNGKSFVYEYSIRWTLGNKYPVSLQIKNYYAPVVKTQRGAQNVKAQEKSDEQSFTMKLSMNEWEYILYMIQANMRLFENNIGGNAYRMAANMDKAARQQRQEKHEQQI